MIYQEVWLRGNKTESLSAFLQPAADALLQAKEEIEVILKDFPAEKLWEKPAGCASVGFHLLHINGFLDRLLTYAENKPLSESQLSYLKAEIQQHDLQVKELLQAFDHTIQHTIERMKNFQESELTTFRPVGRQQAPSSVIGLCFHAAEHTMRHTGQLLVTVKILTQA